MEGLAGPGPGSLTSDEREKLISRLVRKEEVLIAIGSVLQPGAAPPTLPGDVFRLDRLAAAREERDACVVANARVMQATTGQAGKPLPASLVLNATNGSEVQREAAARPWVFAVDRMLSEFLAK